MQIRGDYGHGPNAHPLNVQIHSANNIKGYMKVMFIRINLTSFLGSEKIHYLPKTKNVK